ncbi:MAG: GNAT family N-acetyltransferase [Nocardioidaceae bacterium]|nr:GNAT family N-acetyltransferase [Nocardioidaceae bacterium]
MQIMAAGLPEDADVIVSFVTRTSPRTDRAILRSGLVAQTAAFLRVLLARQPDGALAAVAIGRAGSNLPAGALFALVVVRPDLRGSGVGSALFARLMADLPSDLTRLASGVFADDEASLAVARHWGFESVGLSVTTSCEVSTASAPTPLGNLSLETCDDLRFADEDAVEAMLLASQTNPEADLGLVLDLASLRETPAPGQRAVTALARVDGHPAAISYAVADGDQMHVIYTGVDPARRGNALARATKEYLHAHAAGLGIRTVLTDNDEENPGIRRVNEQLGYTPHSATHWMMRPRP